MRGSLIGYRMPSLWAIDRGRAMEARAEYRRGARLHDLADKYKVSYGTMQTVISGSHPCFDVKLPSIARPKGTPA